MEKQFIGQNSPCQGEEDSTFVDNMPESYKNARRKSKSRAMEINFYLDSRISV
ncbi:MAG: hypothetical protein OIF51_13560 [Cellvibrionaceae bacterium]|nr:hypothetical protein [Cellvibrionaceae bacterium]